MALKFVWLTIQVIRGYDELNIVKELIHATGCYHFVYLPSLGVFTGNTAASNRYFYAGTTDEDTDDYADCHRHAYAGSDRNTHYYPDTALSSRRNGTQRFRGGG
jgi:hypothetical protein